MVAGIVALTRLGQAPGMAWVSLVHLLVFPAVLLLTRPGAGVVRQGLREIAPLLLLAWFYTAFGILNRGVTAHDLTVQHWEQALFGGQPSRDWWRSHPSRFWSTLLHGAYWAYYPIVVTPAVWFATRNDMPGLRRYLFATLTAFVICYLGFLFFPVAGPYYAFPRPEGAFVDNPPARLVYATLAAGSSFGTAFPSSHVAATLSATFGSMRSAPVLGRVLLLPALLLTVGTVYCQMHYAVDALSGVLVGVVVPVIAVMADRTSPS